LEGVGWSAAIQADFAAWLRVASLLHPGSVINPNLWKWVNGKT